MCLGIHVFWPLISKRVRIVVGIQMSCSTKLIQRIQLIFTVAQFIVLHALSPPDVSPVYRSLVEQHERIGAHTATQNTVEGAGLS